MTKRRLLLLLEGRTGETAAADSTRIWAGRIADSFYIDLSLLSIVNAAVAKGTPVDLSGWRPETAQNSFAGTPPGGLHATCTPSGGGPRRQSREALRCRRGAGCRVLVPPAVTDPLIITRWLVWLLTSLIKHDLWIDLKPEADNG